MIEKKAMPKARISPMRAFGIAALSLTLFTGCGANDDVITVSPSPIPTQYSVPLDVEEEPKDVPVPQIIYTMPESHPERVRIPSIGVDSELMDLGLKKNGKMEVPPGGFPAGWYTGSPTPGEMGPAVIAGHVDWTDGPGVFYNLRDLKPGDDIIVNRADGTEAIFRVTAMEQADKDSFPTDKVYGDIDHAGLRLITCGGSFDRKSGHYVDNIIVYAEIVSPDVPVLPE